MTKQMIKAALTELLEKEDIHSISIRMLCEKADINRSTFYLHYATLDDLLNEYCEEYMNTIWQNDRDIMHRQDYAMILTAILKNPYPYRALLKSGLYHKYILHQYEQIDFENNLVFRQYDRNAFMMISSYTIAGMEQMILYIIDHPDMYFSIENIADSMYRLNNSALQQIQLLTRHKSTIKYDDQIR